MLSISVVLARFLSYIWQSFRIKMLVDISIKYVYADGVSIRIQRIVGVWRD